MPNNNFQCSLSSLYHSCRARIFGHSLPTPEEHKPPVEREGCTFLFLIAAPLRQGWCNPVSISRHGPDHGRSMLWTEYFLLFTLFFFFWTMAFGMGCTESSTMDNRFEKAFFVFFTPRSFSQLSFSSWENVIPE